MSKKDLTRRNFITKTTAGLAGVAITSGTTAMSAASYKRIIGSNDRINIGLLRFRDRSGGHQNMVKMSIKDKNLGVVAVCDIWENNKKTSPLWKEKFYGLS